MDALQTVEQFIDWMEEKGVNQMSGRGADMESSESGTRELLESMVPIGNSQKLASLNSSTSTTSGNPQSSADVTSLSMVPGGVTVAPSMPLLMNTNPFKSTIQNHHNLSSSVVQLPTFTRPDLETRRSTTMALQVVEEFIRWAEGGGANQMSRRAVAMDSSDAGLRDLLRMKVPIQNPRLLTLLNFSTSSTTANHKMSGEVANLASMNSEQDTMTPTMTSKEGNGKLNNTYPVESPIQSVLSSNLSVVQPPTPSTSDSNIPTNTGVQSSKCIVCGEQKPHYEVTKMKKGEADIVIMISNFHGIYDLEKAQIERKAIVNCCTRHLNHLCNSAMNYFGVTRPASISPENPKARDAHKIFEEIRRPTSKLKNEEERHSYQRLTLFCNHLQLFLKKYKTN